MDFAGFKLSSDILHSLEQFHGHAVSYRGGDTYRNSVGTLATEVYVTHPDGSYGYEHTVDGITWIPRERSIFK